METPFSLQERAGGLLMHPTSLPGGHGIGDLGPAAYRFADFLAESGQGWWQMLPTGPAGVGNSPYMSTSAFAGNPLLISLKTLEEENLLDSDDLTPDPAFEEKRVNFAAVYPYKREKLRQAHENFLKEDHPEKKEAFREFCDREKDWLEDFALYGALRQLHKEKSWTKWEAGVRSRDPDALRKAAEENSGLVEYQKFLQFLFYKQWFDLKTYCNERGIGLIGDIPIYMAHESAEVWARQELFRLDAKGKPEVVAGVPPDYFSKTGQRWGNPIYRWDVMKENGFEWWIHRFRKIFRQYDAVRIDHFIGFCRYYEIPAKERTAKNGRYVEGPGAEFFEKVLGELGRLELIAEDLGVVTEEVHALRDRFDFPGMRVLQFAFGESDPIHHGPEKYPKRCVVYTGTHDNDTVMGWYRDRGGKKSTRTKEQIERERSKFLEFVGGERQDLEPNWEMIRIAWSSPPAAAIAPVQDLLGFGSESRMNLPGTKSGNWGWRMEAGVLTSDIAMRLRRLTEGSGRLRAVEAGKSE